MERRGGHKEVFAWLPLLFPMRGGLGLWFPYGFLNCIYLLYKEKSSLPDGPFSAMLQAVPLAALRSKETPAQVKEKPLGEAPLQACFGSGVRLPPSLLERPMNTA